MAWNPELYLQFGNERTRPVWDLLARIPLDYVRKGIDLGCGPGNSTAVLQQYWPDGSLIGLDSDEAMLNTARQLPLRVEWILGDASKWTGENEYDLVFSNAALQWLPKHEEVLPRWFTSLTKGGCLAVQIPAHARSPLHQAILELSHDPKWDTHLDSARNELETHEPDFFYDVLSPLTKKLDIWVTEYCHILPSHEAILNWIRGTGLRPFLNRLNTQEEQKEFETRLLERIRKDYPQRGNGNVMFPFRRVFFVAERE